MRYAYGYYTKISNYILDIIEEKAEIGIVLGSGFSGFCDLIENKIEIDYKEIPNFLTTTVKGHEGKLVTGTIAGKRVVCMSGRFHYYEGYDFERLSIPMRVFNLLGVKNVILTNSARALNDSFKLGDIMLINDHIKLTAPSPLRGNPIKEFGERHIDMTNIYDKKLIDKAKNIATDLKIEIKEGVYFYTTGPQKETPAEVRAMKLLGGDVVGMSIVSEAITAAHCKIKVLGLSHIKELANSSGSRQEKVNESTFKLIAKLAGNI